MQSAFNLLSSFRIEVIIRSLQKLSVFYQNCNILGSQSDSLTLMVENDLIDTLGLKKIKAVTIFITEMLVR
jgi:hypothetical protein